MEAALGYGCLFYRHLLFFVTLPNWFEENRSIVAIAHNLHFWLSYSLLALVALHMIEQRQFLRKTWKRIFKA